MPINILVIDDEFSQTKRLINRLKKHSNGYIDQIHVESTLDSIDKVEKFSFDNISFNVDVVMIDYQLNLEYTGVTLSAMMANQKYKVPRISLSSAHPDDEFFRFEGSILKNDIDKKPDEVLFLIKSVIENFNKESWIEEEYKKVCDEYLRVKEENPLNTNIEKLESLLDKLENNINIQISESIIRQDKIHEEYFGLDIQGLRQKIEEGNKEIERLIKEIKDENI